jgi:hypothetical protein
VPAAGLSVGRKHSSTLDAIVSAAVSALHADRDAGLILLERGKLVPQAVSGRAPLHLDLQQQQAGKGPCIEAAQWQAAKPSALKKTVDAVIS